MARFRVGTSGYSYPHWRRLFYPEGLAAEHWLAFYARTFDCLELNTTFYRLPAPHAVERWEAEVPERFRFAVKGSRYLTHLRRLTDRERGVRRFFDALAPLGPKRGPVLWQLPPTFSADAERLEAFLSALPVGDYALEVRHPSWLCDEVYRVLERHRTALVLHDAMEAAWPWPPPGPFLYGRFHGTTGRYAGRYGRARLRRVARRIQELGREAWLFFNNDTGGHAVRDALELVDLLGQSARAASTADSASAVCDAYTVPTNGSGRPSL